MVQDPRGSEVSDSVREYAVPDAPLSASVGFLFTEHTKNSYHETIEHSAAAEDIYKPKECSFIRYS